MSAPDTLLIDFGDLGSLTLFSLQADPTRLLLWHPRETGESAPGRLAAVHGHASIVGEDRLIIADAFPPPAPNADQPAHLIEVQTLLRASSAAMHLTCTRILWPGHIGEDHAAVADALERINAVADLADPTESLLIDAPVIDLTDAQLVDLAEDAGAPMHAFWPCQHNGGEPCGACERCARWLSAFEFAELDWPWHRELTLRHVTSR